MAKNESSPVIPKRKKKKPRRNYRQIVMTVLIVLALISFVLPDILPLIMPRGGGASASGNSAPIPPPTNTPAMPAEPTFTKEGELSIISAETGEAIKTIDIEVADDDRQRALGLMFRRSMKDEQGMLFLFERSEPQRFWMKNTFIPLDIIFVDKDKKITTIHANTNPKSELSLPSDGDALYVLEVNGGWCQRHGVKVGDILQW